MISVSIQIGWARTLKVNCVSGFALPNTPNCLLPENTSMSFNPLTRAIFIARRTIPKEIINEVFGQPRFTYASKVTNIDDEIATKVIRPRVIVDCDIVGGMQVDIRVANCEVQRTADQMTVIYVPKNQTQGRAITQALSLSLIDMLSGASGMAAGAFSACSSTSTSMASNAIHNSFAAQPRNHTTRLELVGENTVLVQDNMIVTNYGTLTAILANDENLSNLPVRFYNYFCTLSKLAIQSHIYNELIIHLDEGKIKAGYQLGMFRTIVEGFADAENQYQEFLDTKWKKVSIMADRKTYHELIRAQIGAPR